MSRCSQCKSLWGDLPPLYIAVSRARRFNDCPREIHKTGDLKLHNCLRKQCGKLGKPSMEPHSPDRRCGRALPSAALVASQRPLMKLRAAEPVEPLQ